MVEGTTDRDVSGRVLDGSRFRDRGDEGLRGDLPPLVLPLHLILDFKNQEFRG